MENNPTVRHLAAEDVVSERYFCASVSMSHFRGPKRISCHVRKDLFHLYDLSVYAIWIARCGSRTQKDWYIIGCALGRHGRATDSTTTRTTSLANIVWMARQHCRTTETLGIVHVKIVLTITDVVVASSSYCLLLSAPSQFPKNDVGRDNSAPHVVYTTRRDKPDPHIN